MFVEPDGKGCIEESKNVIWQVCKGTAGCNTKIDPEAGTFTRKVNNTEVTFPKTWKCKEF